MAKFVSLDNLKTFLAELRKLFVVQESGKTLSTNDYTTTEKDKLATIEASAQENKIESITLGTSVLPIVGKNVTIDTMPANEIKSMLQRIPKFDIQVVTALPTQDIGASTIYLLKNPAEQNQNLYTEYVYINNAWEQLGSQVVDLTNYALKSEIKTKTSELINDAGFSKSKDSAIPIYKIEDKGAVTTLSITKENFYESSVYKVNLDGSQGAEFELELPKNLDAGMYTVYVDAIWNQNKLKMAQNTIVFSNELRFPTIKKFNDDAAKTVGEVVFTFRTFDGGATWLCERCDQYYVAVRTVTPANGTITVNGNSAPESRFRVGTDVTIAASSNPGYMVSELHVSSEEDTDQP